jgi:ABC-type nitrate/sulfonate/bicarbonate transport system ATPase subunit
MKAIAIDGLSKSFGDRVVFDAFSLNVNRGEIVAILGPSGCGKSTLLRCIAGLEKPGAGSIAVAGEIGMIFQEPRLLPWKNVRDNVAFAARNDIERARVDETIELVGLTGAKSRLPKHLSGGMAQRAALARSLIRRPEVLLLDEPLGALDALLRLELGRAIADILAQAKMTSILVTHDVDEAIALADRVIVLSAHPAQVRLELQIDAAARAGEPIAHDAQRTALLRALGVERVLQVPHVTILPYVAVGEDAFA